MHKIIVVTGRPFAGKRIFADYLNTNSDNLFRYIPAKEVDHGGLLFSYFSKKEKKTIAVPISHLLDAIDEDTIPVFACDNQSVREILSKSNDYQLDVYTVYLDIDFDTLISRFLHTLVETTITPAYAEIITDNLIDIINNEKNSFHYVNYDLEINNKSLRKSHINKIKRLINNKKKKPKAEVIKRDVSGNTSFYVIGLKAYIYNQINAYKVLNKYSIPALSRGIAHMVRHYNSKFEEGI